MMKFPILVSGSRIAVYDLGLCCAKQITQDSPLIDIKDGIYKGKIEERTKMKSGFILSSFDNRLKAAIKEADNTDETIDVKVSNQDQAFHFENIPIIASADEQDAIAEVISSYANSRPNNNGIALNRYLSQEYEKLIESLYHYQSLNTSNPVIKAIMDKEDRYRKLATAIEFIKSLSISENYQELNISTFLFELSKYNELFGYETTTRQLELTNQSLEAATKNKDVYETYSKLVTDFNIKTPQKSLLRSKLQ